MHRVLRPITLYLAGGPPATWFLLCLPASCTLDPAPCLHLLVPVQVFAVCGTDILYNQPLIKFTKACYQLVSVQSWYLSGTLAECRRAAPRT